MNNKELIDKVAQIVRPIADERKYYVVDIACKRETGNTVLRIVLDKEGGINIDECAKLNAELNEILEKEDQVDEQYTVEVSSPGLDRKLVKDTDFTWAVGKKVKVTTYAPIDGKNTFSGIFVGMGENTIVVDENGASCEIPREKIAKAKVNEI